MITLNQLVYDLLNTARGGLLSDDESISTKQVAFWIRNTRAKLIRQDINKGRSVNPDLVQTLGCVPVEFVDASECGCTLIGCNVLRTVNPIPKTIELYSKNLITRVGSIDTIQKPYSIISYFRVPFLGSDKFTKKLIRSVLHNGYIYLIQNDKLPKLKFINIQGVFEDPTEAAVFTHCSGDACYTDDSNYPIASWMIEDLKSMIVNADFKLILNSLTDNKGDGKSDLQPNNAQ